MLSYILSYIYEVIGLTGIHAARNVRSCQNCHCLSNEDFKQVANLKKSGLIIYIHNNKSKQKINYCDYSGSNIILHNTTDKDIKRYDYIVELCQYRTKCLRCKMLIQRVRNVIDEISIINKNDVIGVCDFCKRSHQKHKCKRCQYIVEKFVTNKAKENEYRDLQFKQWLSALQQILITIFESNVICKHNISLDFENKSQLCRLLNFLKSPVPMRQPEIGAFPELFDLKETGFDIVESGKLLENLVTQLKYKEIGEKNDIELSSRSSASDSECICKHFVYNKSDRKPGSSIDIRSQDKIAVSKISIATGNENQYKSKSEILTENPSMGQKSKLTEVSKNTQGRKLKSNKENVLPKEIINSNVKKDTGKKGTEKKGAEKVGAEKKGIGKVKKERLTSEYRLMMQLLKNREKEKKAFQKIEKIQIKHQLPVIKDLPELKPRRRPVRTDSLETQQSDSILECKDKHLLPVHEMIQGTKIVHLPSNYHVIDEEIEKLPLLFKIKTDVTAPTNNNNKQSFSLPIPESRSKHKKSEKDIKSGIIRYELSNREFIEKGWTKLPSTKIMRRMNIYRMLPASDKYDWFKKYKKQRTLYYNTGEKFAEINDTGGGKWFYKNGNVALDGYTVEESNTVKRYVIYSSGEEIVGKKKEPITVLACFDYMGNGVVYDVYGNVRLKYNQSEGVVVDRNISAPGRWKWHTLNDPPVLQQVYLDTRDNSKTNECSNGPNNVCDNTIQANEEMIAIELDNFVKEKAHKLLQKFKPFQIRIKVLKINDIFSLRIVDQAKIFLIFRCDGIYFKISIGMLLKSHEIIDTDIAEVSEVSTPYDTFPPRSPSLIDIQNTLCNVRKHYGSSKKNKSKSWFI